MGLFSGLFGGGGNAAGIAIEQANKTNRQARQYQQQIGNAFRDYRVMGGRAAMSLQDLVGDPDAFLESFRTDPGYQFASEQGLQGIDRMQSERGNLYSGQALKEGMRFNQGLADQQFGSYIERLLAMSDRGQSAVGQQFALQAPFFQAQAGARNDKAGAIAASEAAQSNGMMSLLGLGAGIAGQAFGGPIGGAIGRGIGGLFNAGGGAAPAMPGPAMGQQAGIGGGYWPFAR